MNWNDLSMAYRANLIRLGLNNGITNLQTIREIYNKYANGGDLSKDDEYYDYMQQLAEKKARDWGINEDITLIRMLNDNTYNYRAFYDNDPVMARKMLTEDKDAHFSDIGKTVYHPTFSNESIYSGKKSDYNPRGTIGGMWYDDYKKKKSQHYFIPSKSQLTNNDFNYFITRSYLDSGGESNVEIVMPYSTKVADVYNERRKKKI